MGICRAILGLPALTLTAALGGCGWMSVSGPAATDILSGQRDPVSLNYAIVKVTPKVIEVLSRNLPRLVAFKDNRRPRDITFGVGDILSVTIFEAASGGLFIPAEGGVRPGNFVSIPNQAVDIHGNISIPYAGSIRARGRTQVEVQAAIDGRAEDVHDQQFGRGTLGAHSRDRLARAYARRHQPGRHGDDRRDLGSRRSRNLGASGAKRTARDRPLWRAGL